MNSNIKNTKWGLVLGIVWTQWVACQWAPVKTQELKQGTSVDLEIRLATLAKTAQVLPSRPTDSVHLIVSAPDLPMREYGFGGGQTRFSLENLTPGNNRRFQVQLLLRGKMQYSGETEVTLFADKKNSIFLHCKPNFSRVTASLHIPMDFPKSIAKGLLRIQGLRDSFETPAVRLGEFLNFVLEEVPGDQEYSVNVTLWDSLNTVLATGFNPKVRVPNGESIVLEIPLSTSFSQIQMSISVANPQRTGLLFSLPASRRNPQKSGEIIFSELFPAPAFEDSGSLGEWLEFYNRTSDTLNLDACKLIRDDGGSSSKQVIFPSGLSIAPGKTFVIGHKYAPKIDLLVAAFSLTNSASNLQLQCLDGTLVLDELNYSFSAADSTVIPAREGKVSVLKTEALVERRKPSSWCLVSSHPEPNGGYPSPGSLDSGCAIQVGSVFTEASISPFLINP